MTYNYLEGAITLLVDGNEEWGLPVVEARSLSVEFDFLENLFSHKILINICLY